MVLAVVVVGLVSLVAVHAAAEHALDQDEVTSQLVATGHLDDWPPRVSSAASAGRWATGAELHRYLEVDDGSTPGAVQADLREHDLHPPLYFWTLLGLRTAGLDLLWSGPVLNLAAVLAAAAIVYLLLLDELRRPLSAALGTAVFALSPGLIEATSFTRQYPLLMLAGVALIWVTTRLLRPGPLRGPLVALIAVGVFGLLTVTQFAFTLLGALVVLTLRWLRPDPRRMGWIAGSVAASGAIALAIHPGYLDQYDRLNRMLDANAAIPATTRARNWIDGFSAFMALGSIRAVVLLGFAFVLLMVVLLAWHPKGERRAARGSFGARTMKQLEREPVVAAALGVGGIALVGATAAYVLGRTPVHAVGARYLLFFWPPAVLVGAAVVRRWFARPTVVLGVLAVLMLVSSCLWVVSSTIDLAPQRRAVTALQGATLVVTDCLRRDTTPGAAWWVPPEARILLPARHTPHPPAVPPGADRTRPLLLHTDLCPGGPAVDQGQWLRSLGFVRGERVGPVAQATVYRLDPA